MKKIMAVFAALILVSCFMAGQVKAERFKMPSLPPAYSDKSTVLDKGSGSQLYQAIEKTEIGTEGEKKFVRYTQEGNGKYKGSKVPLKWKITGYSYADQYLKPHSTIKEIFSQSGELLKTITYQYDYKIQKVYLTKEDKVNNKTIQQVYDIKSGVFDEGNLSVGILSYDFKGKKDFKFLYLSDEPSLYSITFCYRGKEKVTVPAGTFDCHKIEMVVDLGLMGVVGAFIPKTYFWFTDSDPVQWIKYEGLDGDLGTPYVSMQLIEHKTNEGGEQKE